MYHKRPTNSRASPGSSSASFGQTTSPITTALSALVELGIDGVRAADFVKLLPPDQMEPALNIIAEVRAYFQGLAHKRFADNVPLAIDHELVRGLKEDILSVIFSNLRIHGKDGQKICQELAQESPQIAGRREELMKLERMQTASQELPHT